MSYHPGQDGIPNMGMRHEGGSMLDYDVSMDLDLDLSGPGDQSFGPITPQHVSSGNAASGGTRDQLSGASNGGGGGSTYSTQGQQQDTQMTGAGAGPLPSSRWLDTRTRWNSRLTYSRLRHGRAHKHEHPN